MKAYLGVRISLPFALRQGSDGNVGPSVLWFVQRIHNYTIIPRK
jgi:hypothetical protein